MKYTKEKQYKKLRQIRDDELYKKHGCIDKRTPIGKKLKKRLYRDLDNYDNTPLKTCYQEYQNKYRHYISFDYFRQALQVVRRENAAYFRLKIKEMNEYKNNRANEIIDTIKDIYAE